MALTANALKGEADRCIAAGMDGYLTKPLTLDRLREEVTRWIGASSAPDSAPAADRSEAAVDRTVVAQMFGDNPAAIARVLGAAIARVLGRFREAGARLVQEIGIATKLDQRRELAHKLKGAARAAGAVRLGDLAATLEQSGQRPPTSRASPPNGGASRVPWRVERQPFLARRGESGTAACSVRTRKVKLSSI